MDFFWSLFVNIIICIFIRPMINSKLSDIVSYTCMCLVYVRLFCIQMCFYCILMWIWPVHTIMKIYFVSINLASVCCYFSDFYPCIAAQPLYLFFFFFFFSIWTSLLRHLINLNLKVILCASEHIRSIVRDCFRSFKQL